MKEKKKVEHKAQKAAAKAGKMKIKNCLANIIIIILKLLNQHDIYLYIYIYI